MNKLLKGRNSMSAWAKWRILCRLLGNPAFRFHYFAQKGLKDHVCSEKFLKWEYLYHKGEKLNLLTPTRYTEKLQWLKLYDHQEIYTTMVDKFSAKQYVADRIGSEYIITLLGVYDCASDIDFDVLPDKFVLKTTHDSGGIVVCKDKKILDIPATRKKLDNSLSRNYYLHSREWPYKHVKPRIIAEAYMEDSRCGELRDYKFFTFGGVPKVLYIAQGRGKGEPTVADFFDMEFNHLPFTIDHDMADVPPEKPENFELMKELAAKLSEGTPQLRVDFYEVDGKVYFGEMTFFHCSGWERFHPEEWDRIFGDWVVLPEKNVLP